LTNFLNKTFYGGTTASVVRKFLFLSFVVRFKTTLAGLLSQLAVGWTTEIRFSVGTGISHFITPFSPALGSTQLFVHGDPKVLSTGLRWGDDTEMYCHVLSD
jgi:hypothetical protein